MAVSQAVLDAAAKRVATGASTVNTAVQGTTATPVSFGSTLNKTVTTPAAASPLNFNPSGTIPKTSVGGQVKFGLPGISNPSSTGSSVGPGATVAPGSPYVPGGPAAKSTTYVPPGQSGSVSVKSTTVTPIEGVDNTPQNTAAFTSGAVSSAASAGGTESAVGAGRLADGTWDPNHIPSSEAEAFQSGVDAYTRKRWLANYYKSKNIPFNPENFDPNFDREAEKLFKEQEVEKSLLDTQINQQTTKAQNAARANQAASDVQLTSSREGVQSLSNEATRSAISNEINTGLAQLQTDLETKKYRLAQLQKGKEQKYLAGREDQIRAQLLAVKEAETALATAQEKQQSNKLTALNTVTDMFSKMVQSGAEIPQEFLQSTADAIGVDVGDLLGVANEYNQEVQRLKEDKTIDTQTKAVALQQAEQNLTDQLSGFSTDAGKNLQTLIKLYESGANQTAISAFKELAGITDYEDPLTKANLEGTVLDQAVKLSVLTGNVHMPGPNGGFIDTKIPTFDAEKFTSEEHRDLMRISLLSDSNRRLLATDLLEQYGSSASPYAEQIIGLSLGSLDGFQTIAEKTQAINMIGKVADTQKWLEDNGYAEHNDALFQNYLDELGAGSIKPGGIGVDPMTLPDVRKVILDNSSVTQSFHAPNTGGSDKGGGHGGVDTVFKDGYVHALRGGTVVQVIPWDGKNPYGNRVIIQDKQGLLWQYSHMGNRTKGGDPFIVKPGDVVSPMEEIGIQGNTGRVYSNKPKSDPTYGVHTDIRIVGGGAKKAGTTEVTPTKAAPPKGGVDRIGYNLKEHGKVFSIDTVEELKDAIFKEFGDEPTKEEMRLFQKYGELGFQKIRENRNAKKKKSTGIDASSITLAPENV